jgi:hypothetical protein
MPLPKYVTGFSDETINDLIQFGHVNIQFDNYSNVYLNTDFKTTSSFISIPIHNIVYDMDYIKSKYNINFEDLQELTEQDLNNSVEDVVSIQDLQQDLLLKNDKIAGLESQLENLLEKAQELAQIKGTLTLVKPLVIDLRKELGQGKRDEDFEEEFPWQSKLTIIREIAEE